MRRFRCGALLAAFACILSGCSLAREEIQQEKDKMVGVFVTEEHVDTGTPEIEVNYKGEFTFKENKEGIPGTLISEEDGPAGIVFEGLEGCGIYDVKLWNEEAQAYVSYSFCDGGFSDVRWEQKNHAVTLEAVLYAESNKSMQFYINPVYMTADGRVYLLAGNGMAVVGVQAEGGAMSQTLSWEETVTENGEESKESGSYTIRVVVAAEKEKRLLFLDENSHIILEMSDEELEKAWEQEENLKAPDGAAYAILEQKGQDGAVTRAICDRDGEPMECIRRLENGRLTKGYLGIDW